MKTSKRIVSFLLSAIMVVTTFLAVGPVFTINAEAADITIGGITQTRVVFDAEGKYELLYEGYRNRFFTGAESNGPTNFVIPGLTEKDNYTPQGMTYWAEKEWILISAYHAASSDKKNSVIYALDAKTTEFVALFNIQNSDGSWNYSHGGGIAASGYNFYYADTDAENDSGSRISYWPLEDMDVAPGTVKTVRIRDSINCSAELFGGKKQDDNNNIVSTDKSAATSYCCYDEGVLWTGNFHFWDDERYSIWAHPDYQSMLVGYRLSGNDSTEEWNNLTKAENGETKSDCAGNPTYVVAIDNSIDRIQYAIVDKGKLYISRSWSRYESTNHIRELDVCDFDLNDPGNIEITINNIKRRGHYVSLDNVTRFGGGKGEAGAQKCLYMGEALCVIDDYLYIFGEGAAYNYRVLKSNGNTCTEPIDVIWKIDQHAIIGNHRPAEELDASHYEKVNSLSEITPEDEYIILHKSQLKDPVTQKEILYLLNSDGGYGIRKLPKDDNPTSQSTGDSVGMLPYTITRYSEEDNGEILHIESTDDENRSIRWKISGANSGDLRIANADSYYENHPYLFFTGRHIVMSSTSNTFLSGMQLLPVEGKPGTFYIASTRATFYESYLWCNDGTVPEYIDKYTNYYQSYAYDLGNYNGHLEVTGTFHPDATGTAYGKGDQGSATKDLIGTALTEDQYYLGEFNIYKRIEDKSASTAETRVYTDLDLALQADGTYDLTLEAYTVGDKQIAKTANNSKPTDYVFVVDASSSIANTKDSSGYRRWGGPEIPSETLSFKSLKAGGIYALHAADGEYYELQYTTEDHGCEKKCSVWIYYVTNSKETYYANYWDNDCRATFTTTKPAIGTDQVLNLGVKSKDISDSTVVLRDFQHFGPYTGNASRIEALRTLVIDMSGQIFAQNSQNRVAFVQFGTSQNAQTGSAWQNSGFYTNSSTSMISAGTTATNAQYAAAFHSKSQFANLQQAVLNMPAGGSDKQAEVGMLLANNILANSSFKYSADDERNACVILITDNAAGYSNNQQTTTNATGCCNSTVMNAKGVKDQHAIVHTIRLREDVTPSGFDVDGYLSCVSSEYPDARRMTNRGTKSALNIDYTHNLTDSKFDSLALCEQIFASIQPSKDYTTMKLDTDTYIRENINLEAFDMAVAKPALIATAEGRYDGLGRLYFDEPKPVSESSGIKSSITTEADGTSSIIAHGFNFTEHYLSPDRASGTGQKLVIKYSGLTLKYNPDSTSDYIVNTAIDNPNKTALYRSEAYMKANDPYKGFPSEHLSVPQYTYVLDYGIDMLDRDINGKLISVDTALQKQSSYKDSVTSENAQLEFVDNSENMLYRIGTDATDISKQYVLIQRPNGDYDWFGINIVPASNVYYEDAQITVPDRTSSDEHKWTTEGTASFNSQAVEIQNDIYGYDKNYANDDSNFSNNTVLKSVVSESNRQSDKATFTFTGEGFDLYSACGTTTGVQVIAIRDSSGALVKSYVIDTYYNQADYNQTFTQVPILRFKCPANSTGSTYGTYTVESTAAYLPSISGAIKAQSVSTQLIDENGVVSYTSEYAETYENEILRELGFEELIGEDVEFISFSDDSVLNGGEGPFAVEEGSFTTQSVTELENYIDGYRIYNPCGDDSEVMAHYPNSEKGAKYYNVIDILDDADSFGGSASDGIYYENTGSILESVTYKSVGTPKNEFYLKASNANTLSFKIPNWDKNTMSVMVSARAAYGSPKLKVHTGEMAIDSKTEMYYNVTDFITDDGKLVISNSGNGLLALNNIKIVDPSSAPSFTFETAGTAEEIQLLLDVDAELVDFNAPKIETEDYPLPEPDIFVPGVSDDSDDDADVPDEKPEEPTNDGFFNKVDNFFTKTGNFFKNIIKKITSFFKS